MRLAHRYTGLILIYEKAGSIAMTVIRRLSTFEVNDERHYVSIICFPYTETHGCALKFANDGRTTASPVFPRVDCTAPEIFVNQRARGDADNQE